MDGGFLCHEISPIQCGTTICTWTPSVRVESGYREERRQARCQTASANDGRASSVSVLRGCHDCATYLHHTHLDAGARRIDVAAVRSGRLCPTGAEFLR